MLSVLSFLLYFLFSYVEASVLTIDGENYSLYSFYSRYPKAQWERADSLQKRRMYDDFINRELSILEAKEIGLDSDPLVATKIRERSLQILVNESYESFVANPLIPESDLSLARKNAKRELFINHILIAFSGAYIKNPPQRTLDEAFVLSQKIKLEFEEGLGLVVLAEKYSDDPSVVKNGGALGWVQWGQTVPSFQIEAFNMEKGILSAPVLTDFGYHLIMVSEERPSDLENMSKEAYEEYIISLSKNTIRDQLRLAALEYDEKKIKEYGVVFNDDGINLIMNFYQNINKKTLLEKGSSASASSVLLSQKNKSVLALYGEKGYGPKWFGHKLERVPYNRQPVFSSVDKIKKTLKTIILQDIAVVEGIQKGIQEGFIYSHKKQSMVSEVLYDAYLKYLVNSIKSPSAVEVESYYNKNIIKYKEQDQVAIRDLRVSNKKVADSLMVLIEKGEDFVLLAQQFSSINPSEGGIVLPFSKKKNPYVYDIANSLFSGKTSKVIQMKDGNYSIIQLLNKLPGKRLPIEKVKKEIESLLIKETQNLKKEKDINRLLEKYDVVLGNILVF